MLRSIFWRLQLFQDSWNYERMQALVCAFTMKPIIEMLYRSNLC
ncbi:hypothetical protein C2H98_18615 [Niallia circulans]|nr:hypothetical protein C2H98_18615 [Niallia circulans]